MHQPTMAYGVTYMAVDNYGFVKLKFCCSFSYVDALNACVRTYVAATSGPLRINNQLINFALLKPVQFRSPPRTNGRTDEMPADHGLTYNYAEIL